MPPGSSAGTQGDSHVVLELSICPANTQRLGEVGHGTPAPRAHLDGQHFCLLMYFLLPGPGRDGVL